jgi:hypothetical protein
MKNLLNVRRSGFHVQHGFHVMPIVSMDEIHSNLKNECGDEMGINALTYQNLRLLP